MKDKQPAYRMSEAFPLRVRHAVVWFPRRWRRLVQHTSRFCFQLPWWVELLFLLLDLLAFPELLETIQDTLFASQRPLTQREFQILYSVFGDTLPYPRLRIDERAHVGARTHRLYYVQCCVINSWGEMPDFILVHEAVHLWQFMQVGSVYIPRALRAQRSVAGYNYGGPSLIRQAALSGNLLQDFNYEQQAELIADYWLIREGRPARWGAGYDAEDLAFYQYFADQLHIDRC